MMTAITKMRTGTVTVKKKGYERNKYSTEFKIKVLTDVENRGDATKASVARKYGMNACVISYFEKERGNSKTYTERLRHKHDDFDLLVSDGVKRRNIDIANEIGVSQTTVGRWIKEAKL